MFLPRLIVALVLTAAPAGRYVVAGDTVVDTRNTLIWQRTLAVNSTYLFSEAQTYCSTLVVDGQGGWRLPDVKELQSLVDERAANPSIDGTAFPGTPFEPFWTSTTSTSNSTYAWVVGFGTGNAYAAVKNGPGRARARCVKN